MKTIELSIRDFISAVSRYWLLILVVGLIFSGSLGTYNYLQQPDKIKSLETKAKFNIEALEKETQRKNTKPLERASQKRIYAIEDSSKMSIKAQEDSSEKSIAILETKLNEKGYTNIAFQDNELAILTQNINKLKNDAAQYEKDLSQTAYLSFSINTGSVVLNPTQKSDLLNMITDQYIVLAEHASYEDILMDFDLDGVTESTLQDRINVSKGKEGTVTIEAANIQNVAGSDIVEALYRYMEKNRQIIASSTADHTFVVMNEGVKKLLPQWAKSVIDEALKRAKEIEEIIRLSEQIKAEKIKLQVELAYISNDLQEKKALEKADLDDQLSDFNNDLMEKIQGIETELSRTIKAEKFKSITNFIVFFLVGVVIASFAVIMIYTMQLTILQPDQIQRQLGVRLLGGVQKKRGVFSSGLGDRLSGQLLQANKAEAVRYISANLTDAVGFGKSVLLMGRFPTELLDDWSTSLSDAMKQYGVEFHAGPDISSNTDSVRLLSQSDAVVLAAQLNVSKLRDINNDIERVRLSGKEVVGYVLI